MSEWQPIETAPEDWLPVLVAVCPPLSRNEVHVAYLSRGEWTVLDEQGNHADFITHWMPLPEPPEADK